MIHVPGNETLPTPTFGKQKPYLGREEYFQESATSLIRFKFPMLNYFHVPNEGKRTLAGNAKLKRQGLLAGVSDIIILTPNKDYHGLVIELKVKTGRVSDSQKNFLQQCLRNGFYACVVYSLDALKEVLTDYLENKDPKNL